jgi:hypothetical protein
MRAERPKENQSYENPDDHVVTGGHRTDGGADWRYARSGYFHHRSGESEEASPQSENGCAGERSYQRCSGCIGDTGRSREEVIFSNGDGFAAAGMGPAAALYLPGKCTKSRLFSLQTSSNKSVSTINDRGWV